MPYLVRLTGPDFPRKPQAESACPGPPSHPGTPSAFTKNMRKNLLILLSGFVLSHMPDALSTPNANIRSSSSPSLSQTTLSLACRPGFPASLAVKASLWYRFLQQVTCSSLGCVLGSRIAGFCANSCLFTEEPAWLFTRVAPWGDFNGVKRPWEIGQATSCGLHSSAGQALPAALVPAASASQ